METKRIKTFDTFFWVSASAFILIVALISFFPILFTSYSSNYDFTETGPIGDTIGGIMGPFIAIAAAALTFLAFWVQYKANEQQKQDIKELKERGEIEKLEAKFFELIKLHRDNIGELSYTYSKWTLKETIEETALARKVFKVIFSDFEELYKELHPFFVKATINEIYEETYLSNLRNNNIIKERTIDLKVYAEIDILYTILYFGLSKSDNKTIRSFFKERYKESFYNILLFCAELKPKTESIYWGNWKMFIKEEEKQRLFYLKTKLDEIKNLADPKLIFIGQAHLLPAYNNIDYITKTYDKYYGGHQFRLGHYFRNLFQAVTLINNDTRIKYKQKYSNIKILRGQLSTYEQSIIFLNSLSILGRVWEFESRNYPNQALCVNNQLITKYNLIKNILNDLIIDNISVSHFYPLVEYESSFSESNKITRENLIKDHWDKNEGISSKQHSK